MFRGCTRPAMFLGVPVLPFFIGAGGCLLLALYINLFLLALMPLVILIMAQMAKRDEMIFRLYGLSLWMRMGVRNLSLNRGAWAFSPNPPRRRKHP